MQAQAKPLLTNITGGRGLRDGWLMENIFGRGVCWNGAAGAERPPPISNLQRSPKAQRPVPPVTSSNGFNLWAQCGNGPPLSPIVILSLIVILPGPVCHFCHPGSRALKAKQKPRRLLLYPQRSEFIAQAFVSLQRLGALFESNN